ncbi:MAG: phosphodiesterase [Succinivibrio sp.]
MRYLVLSDIHGGADEAKTALSYFDKFKCDYLVLLGDLLNHGPRNCVPRSYNPMDLASVLNEYRNKIIAVRGNCDSEVDSMVFSFPCNAPYGYILVPKERGIQKIFLTHGHLFKLDTAEDLEKIGLTKDDIVLSGHTHAAGIFKKESGIVNINPGSTTLPKGTNGAGFALITENSVELYHLDGTKYLSHSF